MPISALRGMLSRTISENVVKKNFSGQGIFLLLYGLKKGMIYRMKDRPNNRIAQYRHRFGADQIEDNRVENYLANFLNPDDFSLDILSENR